jgi:hypothetical protein
MQEVITRSTPKELEPKVCKLLKAKPRLSGAARRKLRKAWAGQGDTKGLVQLEHETLLWLSVGP